MNDMLDDEASRALKAEGMARVIEHAGNFSNQYFTYILSMEVGTVFQNEDIRDIWVGTPAKPQAWGACVNLCINMGVLVWLDEEAHMRSKKSHSRRTHLLMRVTPGKDTAKVMATPRKKGPTSSAAEGVNQ